MKRTGSQHRIAEGFTLVVSCFVILSMAVFLIVDLLRETPDSVKLDIKVKIEETQKVGERFVVPVEIKNSQGLALNTLRLLVQFKDPSKKAREIEIRYLGRHSSQKIFLYLDQPPSPDGIQVLPTLYTLD